MASPRRKTAKPSEDTVEESPPKLAPLRQSPRKKTVQQSAGDSRKLHDPLLILAQAGSVIEEKDNSAAYQPQCRKPEEGADKPQQCSSSSVSREEMPSAKADQKPQKWTKRALQSLDVIPMDILVQLPSRTMVDLFSEPLERTNQYESRFAFQCKFFQDPEDCSEIFHGYRDEGYVRRQIEKHLVMHRNNLIKKGQDANNFKTTSIQFRKKQAESSKKKKSCCLSSAGKQSGRFTSIKSNSSQLDGVEEDQISSHSEASIKVSKPKSSKAKGSRQQLTIKQENKENKPTASVSADPNRLSPNQRKKKPVKAPAVSEASSSEESQEGQPQDADLKPYPECDHGYAAPPGQRCKIEQCSDLDLMDSDDEASVSSEVSMESTASQDLSRGIHHYDEGPVSTPMVCKEETFEEPVQAKKSVSAASKSTGRGQAALNAPNEENGSVDEDADSKAGIKKQRRPALPRTKNDEIPEWEKRLALKCIRELKQRKKDEKIEYVCKICKEGKKFTAGATLIYHYRSHAGIKPFECTDCGQKFTRQHSKNYHMMIHRNESRFVCKECGKRFRHPSHYTEHKRKHTGETPFECEDCQMKFKTRNTYKRHLKTRHGKLLTARGIKRMSREEFAKVRTKPYKKSNESSPSHEHSGTLESAPGPSSQAVDQKPRRMKTSAATQIASNPMTNSSVAVVTAPVALPPVSTILPPFSHPQASPPSTVVTMSQPSVGVIPPMGAIRQASTAVGMLGMTMVGAGLHTPTQMAVVRQAVSVGMGQPLQNLQGQAYYTITAYTPVVPMDTVPATQTVQQARQDVNSHSDEDDNSLYKPVGFITHL